jgi:hypothetical protein
MRCDSTSSICNIAADRPPARGPVRLLHFARKVTTAALDAFIEFLMTTQKASSVCKSDICYVHLFGMLWKSTANSPTLVDRSWL